MNRASHEHEHKHFDEQGVLIHTCITMLIDIMNIHS